MQGQGWSPGGPPPPLFWGPPKTSKRAQTSCAQIHSILVLISYTDPPPPFRNPVSAPEGPHSNPINKFPVSLFRKFPLYQFKKFATISYAKLTLNSWKILRQIQQYPVYLESGNLQPEQTNHVFPDRDFFLPFPVFPVQWGPCRCGCEVGVE